MGCKNPIDDKSVTVEKDEKPQIHVSMEDYKPEISLTLPFKIDSAYKLRFVNYKNLNTKNRYTNSTTLVELIKDDSVVQDYKIQGALNHHNKSLILDKDFEEIVQSYPNKNGEIGIIQFIGQDSYESEIILGRIENNLIDLKYLPNQGIGYGKQKGENYDFKYEIIKKGNTIIIKTKQYLKENDSLLKSYNKEYELHYNQLVIKEYFPKVDTLFNYQFKNDTNYSYHIINKRQNRIFNSFYSILKQGDITIDSNKLRNRKDDYIIYNSGGYLRDSYTDVSIKGVSELGVFTDEGTGETWDGYAYTDILFGKDKSNRLIKEIYTTSEGGTGNSDFSYSFVMDEKFIIPNSKNKLDSYLVINKFYFDEFKNTEKTKKKSNLQYYDFKEKYKLKDNRFVLVDESYEAYVNSKTGLTVRPQANFNEQLGKLNHAEKVIITSKSSVPYNLNEGNGKKIRGYWCKIIYPKAKDSIGYVFDAYLSPTKPIN